MREFNDWTGARCAEDWGTWNLFAPGEDHQPIGRSLVDPITALSLTRRYCTPCPLHQECYNSAEQQRQAGVPVEGVWGAVLFRGVNTPIAGDELAKAARTYASTRRRHDAHRAAEDQLDLDFAAAASDVMKDGAA